MDNSTSDINITYLSKCIGNNSWELSNKCEDLQANDMVTFQIIIQVNNCTNDASDKRKYISIYPKGINISLIINLEVICDCACEKQIAVVCIILLFISMIKKMLARNEECDIYLTHGCRHRCSIENPVKR